MLLKSFSKINLSLSVNKKLKNGLHDIQSYFCLINLYDQIDVKKINGEKDIIKFKGQFARYINKKKNSISETLKILRKQKAITSYYSVTVNKKIPVFAGLGGGTSNAVYLYKYLAHKKISKFLVDILSKKVGSDFELFLHELGFLKNLKSVYSLKNKYKLFFLLVYPNIRSSTKIIYSKVGKYSPKLKHYPNKTNSKKSFIKLLIDKNNDLQLIVEKKYPVIQELLTEIQLKKGCYFSRMSGSGSICYGIFKNQITAKVALNKIKSKYPRFWFSVAKTI